MKVKIIKGTNQIGGCITEISANNSKIIIDFGDDLDDTKESFELEGLTKGKSNYDAIFITHSHGDHIGLINKINKDILVYVENDTLKIHNLTCDFCNKEKVNRDIKTFAIKHNTKNENKDDRKIFDNGDIQVYAYMGDHSSYNSCMFLVEGDGKKLLHTGDFKVDYTPVYGGIIDLQRFGELGKKGVLALMADSTNVERPGFTPSEKTVGKTLDHIFDDNRDRRLIIATFASNVDRVQQIINSAYKYGRKCIVEGRSMVNIINIASELGYINIPGNTLIDIDEASNYKDDQLVYITTGSQGEDMAVLSRIAASVHNKIKIKPGDLVVFSSHPIPGNEKSVYKIINELEMKGAKVIYQDTHVSGHACQEELKLMYALTRPKYAIPVHGEYRHLKAHAELAHEMGIERENIKILKTGDVLSISGDMLEVTGRVPAAGVLVDGLGVGDVGNIVLRDRQHLSENGLIIVAITLEKGSGMVMAGPDIVSRGFVYVRESESLIEDCRMVVEEAIQDNTGRGSADWNKLKTAIRDALGEFLWKRTKRSPMILPIISEV